MDFEDLEADNVKNIVSIPKSVGLAINKEVKQISETPISEDMGAIISKTHPEFKIYEDEIPPVPLEDYTPMEIEEEPLLQEPTPKKTELVSSPEKLPSFEELKPPDFGEEYQASEYDTEFILEEESEALDSVLKDLGWREEED